MRRPLAQALCWFRGACLSAEVQPQRSVLESPYYPELHSACARHCNCALRIPSSMDLPYAHPVSQYILSPGYFIRGIVYSIRRIGYPTYEISHLRIIYPTRQVSCNGVRALRGALQTSGGVPAWSKTWHSCLSSGLHGQPQARSSATGGMLRGEGRSSISLFERFPNLVETSLPRCSGREREETPRCTRQLA